MEVHEKVEQFIVTDNSLVCLSKDGRIDAEYLSAQIEKFDDPATALETALKIREIHKNCLEGSELYVFRIEDSFGSIEKKPVLVTGNQNGMRYMWLRNIGGELPCFLKAKIS